MTFKQFISKSSCITQLMFELNYACTDYNLSVLIRINDAKPIFFLLSVILLDFTSTRQDVLDETRLTRQSKTDSTIKGSSHMTIL